MAHSAHLLRLCACAALAYPLASCSSDSGLGVTPSASAPPSGETEFISNLSSEDQGRSVSVNAGAPAAATDSNALPESGGSAERAISEADIIKLEGDTLYALSEYSGLTLVDTSDPTSLSVLGRHQVAGTPFEMYFEDGVAIAMFNAFGQYVYDEAEAQTQWVETSRVQALNVSDPSAIKVVGDLSVPGTISDSRLVGDVLYLVTTEYGCWGCSTGPSTVVTSFSLSDLSQVKQIDQLRFSEPADSYIGQRSITVTSERIYIGGRDWNWQADSTSSGSTIQVVDISDPEGDLKVGAALPIAGYINSRWQMDEHGGVLRVLSQWDEWRSDSPPALETYRVLSATDITKLARLDVVLPRPEVLQSVRFDGDNAYAITFERTDPLFTFDLSDPEHPKQMGELEIPGWVYHMEPRGDRVYGIGFDQASSEGALHVSLFDVSDLKEPRMLSRVNFGGDWANFAEDQDRIHKSFRLLDEHGFLVVPFSGWETDDAASCSSSYASGIQIVDYTRDSLSLRGVAPQVGEARRALVHRDHLFGIGDDAVQTFDISDRDSVKKVDTLETARNITTVRVVGDQVLRFGVDWWTDRTLLDVTSLETADSPSKATELDLSALLVEESDECNGYGYWGNVYVHGSFAYVERYNSRYEGGGSSEKLSFFVVDFRDPNLPVVVGTFAAETTTSSDRNYSYHTGVVQTDNALLVGVSQYSYSEDYTTTHQSQHYQVFDLKDPAAPTLSATLDVPANLVTNGWGRFTFGCGIDRAWGWGGYYGYYGAQETTLVSGNIVASSHSEPLADDPTRGRYFLDRIDVTDPAHPTLLEKVNIPGRVVHYEHDSGRTLTIADNAETLDLSQDECWALAGREPNVRWTSSSNDSFDQCERTTQSLNLLSVNGNLATLLKQTALGDDGWYLSQTAITSERVFIKQYQTRIVRQEEGEGTFYEYWTRASERIRVLDEHLELVEDFEPTSIASWSSSLRARGTRAFETDPGELRVYDATKKDAAYSYVKDTHGYSCEALEVSGKIAYCAQGKRGVQSIALE